jgi:hypothetical protein
VDPCPTQDNIQARHWHGTQSPDLASLTSIWLNLSLWTWFIQVKVTVAQVQQAISSPLASLDLPDRQEQSSSCFKNDKMSKRHPELFSHKA